MRLIIVFIFSLSIISCITPHERLSDGDIAGRYHRVKKGESLSQIAKKYRSHSSEIMEVNGIEREKSLRVGQELFIPDPDPIGTRIKKHRGNSPLKVAKKTVPKNVQKIFDFPVAKGRIFHRFSSSKQNPYDGLGIKAPRGAPIMAALDGKVIFVGDDGTRYGLLVIIEHRDTYISVYAHLDKAVVKPGQDVKKRDVIGNVGISGGISTPHLHFQIRVNERPHNPEDYLTPGAP